MEKKKITKNQKKREIGKIQNLFFPIFLPDAWFYFTSWPLQYKSLHYAPSNYHYRFMSAITDLISNYSHLCAQIENYHLIPSFWFLALLYQYAYSALIIMVAPQTYRDSLLNLSFSPQLHLIGIKNQKRYPKSPLDFFNFAKNWPKMTQTDPNWLKFAAFVIRNAKIASKGCFKGKASCKGREA